MGQVSRDNSITSVFVECENGKKTSKPFPIAILENLISAKAPMSHVGEMDRVASDITVYSSRLNKESSLMMWFIQFVESSSLAIPPYPPLKNEGQRVTLTALFVAVQSFNPNRAFGLCCWSVLALEQVGNQTHGKRKAPRLGGSITNRGLSRISPQIFDAGLSLSSGGLKHAPLV